MHTNKAACSHPLKAIILLFFMESAWCAEGCSFIPVFAASFDPPMIDGKNVSAGRPYRFNMLPTRQFSASSKLPNPYGILTDGTVENGFFHWTSAACVNFLPSAAGVYGAPPVEITIDLGYSQFISSISTRHSSRISSGIFFPRREEYEIGESESSLTAVAACVPPEKTTKDGILQYGCNAISARGRFVRIKTWGSGQGGLPSYVGYDEVIVYSNPDHRKSRDKNIAWCHPLPAPEMPKRIPGLNYSISAVDWPARAIEQPLLLGPGPSFYLGDDAFYLSKNAVHTIEFIPLVTADEPIENIELSCTLPVVVNVLAWHNRHRLQSSAPFNLGPVAYQTHTMYINGGDLESYLSYPFLQVSITDDVDLGKIGELTWSWSYTIGGRRHSPGSGQLHLISENPIEVLAPRRFTTGFWTPYATRSFSNPSVINRLMTTWKKAGFNTAFGGRGGEIVSNAARQNNLSVICEGGILPNGLSIRDIEIPPEHRFVSRLKNSKIIGVCPTALLEVQRYANHIQRLSELRLKYNDSIYENWEPYNFLSERCICQRCRMAFEKELENTISDSEWQSAVSSADDRYSRFVSNQYALIIKMYQERVRAAGAALSPARHPNVVIALNPDLYVKEKSQERRLHNAKDFMKYIDQICIWSYPNQIPVMHITTEQLVGNTLTTIPLLIEQTLAAARATGRQDPLGRPLPRIIMMQGGYQLNGQHLVLPTDAAFTSLLAFFSGADGIATFEMQQRPDARYLSANARAHELIAALEDVVMDGKDTPGVSVVSISSRPSEIRGRPVQTLWWRAITGAGRQLVAVGNDHVLPAYIRMQIPSQNRCDVVDLVNKCSYSCEFHEGDIDVIVKIDAKSWGIFETTRPVLEKAISREKILDSCRADEPSAKAFIALCQETQLNELGNAEP